MDGFLVIDICFAVFIIIHLVYIKMQKPMGTMLFEIDTFSIYNYMIYIICVLVIAIINYFHNFEAIYHTMLVFLIMTLGLLKEPKKFYIYSNEIYFHTVIGGLIHIGGFTNLIEYQITDKGRLKLIFREANEAEKKVTISRKFNEAELKEMKRIFINKGFYRYNID